MKYLALLIVILSSILSASSQTIKEYDIELHDEFKTKIGRLDQYVASNEAGHFFIYSKGFGSNVSTSLVRFNNNLIPTNEEIILNEDEEESLGIIEIDNSYLSITAKDSKLSRNFFVKSIDLEKLKVEFEKEIISLSADDLNINKSYVRFIIAEDKKSIGLLYSIPSKSKENIKYGLITFDNKFNKLHEFFYEFPKTKGSFAILDATLLNENEVIVLTLQEKSENQGKKSPKFSHSIMSLKKGNIQVLENIEKENKWINGLELIIKDSLINVLGFYSNIDDQSAHGTFFFQIDRLDSLRNFYKLEPFQQNLLDEHKAIINEKQEVLEKITGQNELSNYRPKSILTYKDGSILLIAEQLEITPTLYSTIFSYHNLILIYFDNLGDIAWSKMIKKDNSIVDQYDYSSFLVANDYEDYFLIYNGTSKNLNLGDPRRYDAFADKYAKKKDGSIIIVEIQKNGILNQKVLVDRTQTNGFRIKPRFCVNIREGEFLLFSGKPSRVKDQRFITLKIR
ncbi:hypothetical protein [Ekhidna sp.]|uniref:hypothetical protein n=1 Tax=Ekhidna sp. TaxID=2608089 RepID=UPI003C7BC73F